VYFFFSFKGLSQIDPNDLNKTFICGTQETDMFSRGVSVSESCTIVRTEGYGIDCYHNDAQIPSLDFQQCGNYRIPIRFVTTALNDCSGAPDDINARIDDEMCYINELFSNINIEFVEISRELLCNDIYYDLGDTDISGNDINGVLNVYFVNNVTSNGENVGGYFRGEIVTNFSGLGSLSSNCGLTNCGADGHMNTTLAHEIGHALGLAHPFSGNPIFDDDINFGNDLADNSVCCIESDKICDTEPDPNGLPGASSTSCNSTPSCTYDGTAVDSLGNPYLPFITDNIMSYYTRTCRNKFTDFQYRKMHDYLIYCRNYCLTGIEYYLEDTLQKHLSICLGDAIPEINGKNNRCFNWYINEPEESNLILEDSNTLSSEIISSQIDSLVPGTYSIFIQDANNYQSNYCTSEFFIEILPEPGNGNVSGYETFNSCGINEYLVTTSNLQIDSNCQTIGWVLNQDVPISDLLSTQDEIVNYLNSNPNNIYESDNNTLQLEVNCNESNLYYLTPFVSYIYEGLDETVYDCDNMPEICSSVISIDYCPEIINEQDFFRTGPIPKPDFGCFEIPPPNWEINIEFLNFGNCLSSLSVRLRSDDGENELLYSTIIDTSEANLTLTSETINFDASRGFRIIVFDIEDFCCGTAEFKAEVEIIYESIENTEFPSPKFSSIPSNEEQNCFFGTPLEYGETAH